MTIPQLIDAAAAHYDVDSRIAQAVARKESGLNQAAVSPRGAIGVFQLMPGTAADLNVNPFNLAENIDGGVRYLGQMLRRFGGDVGLGLAAYNWGPANIAEAVAKWGGEWIGHVPAETRDYVLTIAGWISGSAPGESSGAGAQNTLLILAAVVLGGALLISIAE